MPRAEARCCVRRVSRRALHTAIAEPFDPHARRTLESLTSHAVQCAARATENHQKPPMSRSLLFASMLTFSAIAAAQTPAPAAPAGGDASKGREKTQMCEGCHGIEGWRTAFPEVYRVPRLGGQHEAYLVSALKQYKNGERSHPSMRAIAGSLSDADIANLAAYYAAGKVKTATQ
jgi:cytochrome c553